jgi:hypothetical protein
MTDHRPAQVCDWQCLLLILNLGSLGYGLHIDVHRLLEFLHAYWISVFVLGREHPGGCNP